MSQKVNSIALRLNTEKHWKLKTKNFDFPQNTQKNLLLVKLIHIYLSRFNFVLVDYKLTDWGNAKFFFGYIHTQKRWKQKKNQNFFYKKKLSQRLSIKDNNLKLLFWRAVKKSKLQSLKLNLKLNALKLNQKLILQLQKKLKEKNSINKCKSKRIRTFLRLKQVKQKCKLYTVNRVRKLKQKKYWSLKNKKYTFQLKEFQKNKIKNLLILYKVKLKIQNKLQAVLKTYVNLSLKNCWKEVPLKLKKKNWVILKKAKQYRQNKNLSELISILSLAFFFKKINFFTDFIARELEKNKQHWKILNSIKYIIHELNRGRPGIIGFRLSIWGKINNSKRTRKYTVSMGQVALGNLRYQADYSLSHSYTAYGLFGIKSWLVY